MENIGKYEVYLTGSKKFVYDRVVWKKGDRYYITWYGQKIEVVVNDGWYHRFRTVEAY